VNGKWADYLGSLSSRTASQILKINNKIDCQKQSICCKKQMDMLCLELVVKKMTLELEDW
jgi:hypothetical protein